MNYGLFPDIANEDYHNWEKYPAVSSTMLRMIRKQSPLHVKTVMDGKHKKETKPMEFGDISHKIILNNEVDSLILQPIDISVRRGSRWETFKAAHPGKTIVSSDQLNNVIEMVKPIKEKKLANDIIENCTGVELSGFWESPHHGFNCKMRTDIINKDMQLIADYKTTADASPEAFSRHFFKYGYDVQAAWYLQGIKAITGISYEFVLIVQEKEPPYEVACAYVSPEIIEIGRTKIAWASQLFEKCLKEDDWPGYPEMYAIQMQGWAKAEAEAIKEQIRNDENLQKTKE